MILLLAGCDIDFKKANLSSGKSGRDLESIKKDGVITAVTDFNSTNYFIYKGEPMGYQFDMLQAFAEHIGVKLELIAENNLDVAFKMLEDGEVDLFANNLTITAERKQRFLFTIPHSTTKQVLVQKKAAGYSPIRTPLDLAGKIVYVQKGSASAHRLKNLSEEIGAEVVIVEMAKYEADELIELVANGEIDFTVCDEDVATVNAFYFDNIDIETPVSFDQNLAWAVNTYSTSLHEALNQWLEDFTQTAEYRIIKGKYFNNPFWARRVLSENVRIKMGHISMYDEGFKHASLSID
ncbi:MAG TPA: transporter substrate-binding domain-containing protein, partial [Tenuifilaceae bacterium]|nr:transporter substrate-binding domain-containing protein [Tenuifilaceae bacterium]